MVLIFAAWECCTLVIVVIDCHIPQFTLDQCRNWLKTHYYMTVMTVGSNTLDQHHTDYVKVGPNTPHWINHTGLRHAESDTILAGRSIGIHTGSTCTGLNLINTSSSMGIHTGAGWIWYNQIPTESTEAGWSTKVDNSSTGTTPDQHHTRLK